MSAIALYARATAGHDDRVAATLQRLRDAAAAHAGRIVQSTSLGAEDMVVTDLIARHRPDEILLTGMIHNHAARMHSFALTAQVMRSLG